MLIFVYPILIALANFRLSPGLSNPRVTIFRLHILLKDDVLYFMVKSYTKTMPRVKKIIEVILFLFVCTISLDKPKNSL